jgi:hypothetical protein
VQLLSEIKVVHRLLPGSRYTGEEKEADQRGANPSDGGHSETVVANPSRLCKGVFWHEEQGNAPPEERGKVARFGVFFRLPSDELLLMRDILELVELFGIGR